MDKIAAGVVKFQQEAYHEHRDLFEKLAEGQSPECLFITCADSRIDPNLVTQTVPGELFIVRNAGNIVPPHSQYTGAMTASIEFAVGALRVPHIVICGHSECGALKGAMNPEALNDFPHVKEWLGYARAAVLVTRRRGASLSDKDQIDMLTRENVLLQIAHLRTHPYVAAQLAAGETEIHGWVYDIRSGEVLAYCDRKNEFVPVAERYPQSVRTALHTHHQRDSQ